MEGFALLMMGAEIWPALLSAFAITAVALKLLRRPAMRWRLVDQPGGRKTHERPTPVIGGVVILVAFTLAFTMLTPGTGNPAGWAGFILLGLAGLVDDAFGLRSFPKLLIQILAAGMAVLWGGLVLNELGSWSADTVITLGVLAIPVTWFAMVGFINAVNMLDGLDGLAGGVVVVMLLWLAFAAGLAGLQAPVHIALLLAAALAGFLIHNLRSPWRRRASVFLGDSGSLALGFAVGWLAIEISQAPGRVISPIGIAWILVLPVMDTLSLMIRRMIRGRNPFHADRNHLHHVLGRAGFTQAQAAAILILISLVLGAVGVFGSLIGVPDVLLGAGLIAVASAHYLFVRYAWRSTRALKRLRASSQPLSGYDQLALSGMVLFALGLPFAAEAFMWLGLALLAVASLPQAGVIAADLRCIRMTWIALALLAWLTLAQWLGPDAVDARWLALFGISGLLAMFFGWWLQRLRFYLSALLATAVVSTLLASSSSVRWPMLEAGLIRGGIQGSDSAVGGVLLALMIMPLIAGFASGFAHFRQRWRARALFGASAVLITLALLFLLGSESRSAIIAGLAGLLVLVVAAAAHGVGQRLWAGVAGGAISLVLLASLLANIFKPPETSLTEAYLEPVQSALLYLAGEPGLASERYPAVSARLDDWRLAWQRIAERPLAGHGEMVDGNASAYALLGLMGGWVALGLFILLILFAIAAIARIGVLGHWPLSHVLAAHGAIGVVLMYLFFSPLVFTLEGVLLFNGVLALGVAAAVGTSRARA